MKKNFKYMLLTLVICGSMVFGLGCSKKEESKAAETESQTVETESETELETEMELVRVAPDQNIVNIMLVGQDRRQNDSERQRSDSMILVTLDRVEQTIDLTSFMRDTYVEIPGWGSNRLNAAYVFGGIELMNETFMHNFGVKIDGVVEVDFYDFVEIMDEIGGVEIDVKEEEIPVLNDYVGEVAKHLGENASDHYVTNSGLQRLNGIQTLSYCRIRYVGDADFERTQRQRTVLQTVFNNVKDMGTMKMLDVLDKTFELLNTNLTDEDLLNLMAEALDMGVTEFENHNIPEDAGYSSQSIDGMSVLVPDLEACRAVMESIVNE